MLQKRHFENERALSDWICSHATFNWFISLTLKQGLPTKNGNYVPLTDNDCIHTACIFADRLSKKALGSGRTRSGQRLPIAAFLEGDGKVLRKHLHFVAACPDFDMSPIWLKSEVNRICSRLDWAYKVHDARPIRYGRAEFVTNYCLKAGTDSFRPEASNLRSAP